MIPEINLLPKRERRSSSGSLIFILLGIIFLLFLSVMVFQYVTVSKNIYTLESKEAQLRKENVELTEEYAELTDPKKADLETSVQFVESVSYPVSPVIVELNRYLDRHSYLRSYAFGEDKVSFSVDFESLAEAAIYLEDLLSSPYVKDVHLNSSSAFDPVSVDEEEDRFTVSDRFTNTFEVLINLKYLRELDGGNR